MSAVFLTQYDGAFLGPIARVLGEILELLANFLNMFGIMNVGLTIILFTLLINTLMIPLTIKQAKFSKLQSRMAPELSRIQKKYKGKRDEESMRKQQLETQAVYQKFGTSPAGGCLPMLITFPILFALLKVIYSVPAYVGIYYDIYQGVAKEIMNTPDYVSTLQQWNGQLFQPLQVGLDSWSTASNQVVQDNLVQMLSQFRATDWDKLVTLFNGNTALIETINSTKAASLSLNSFIGGMSVLDTPGFSFPGIIVPLLSGGFQYLQTKLLPSAGTDDPDNPMASTMKSMNIVMPITSVIFCAMMPIGVGLYWIAGSVFRIIQQIFINKHYEHMDVDDLIQKNIDKANKKRAKLGQAPVKIEDLSKVKTSSIETPEDKVKANKKKYEASDYKRNVSTSYKPGSIAANAHLLKRKNGEKGE